MNDSTLATGSNLKVFSPHRVVRVVTADQMSIEIPGGNRLSAQVLDRTGRELVLALPDGRAVKLSMVLDESISDSRPDQQFSQQSWVVN